MKIQWIMKKVYCFLRTFDTHIKSLVNNCRREQLFSIQSKLFAPTFLLLCFYYQLIWYDCSLPNGAFNGFHESKAKLRFSKKERHTNVILNEEVVYKYMQEQHEQHVQIKSPHNRIELLLILEKVMCLYASSDMAMLHYWISYSQTCQRG